MKQPYRLESNFNERSKTAGEEIVRLLVGKGITYQEADDALCWAQRKLAESTVPSLSV